MASNKEPINERVRDIQMYSSEAYHGGLNASTEIGWIEGLTNDFGFTKCLSDRHVSCS